MRKISKVNGIERDSTCSFRWVVRKGKVFKRLMFEQRGSEGSSPRVQNVANGGLRKCNDFV